jgi:hypothetical protein
MQGQGVFRDLYRCLLSRGRKKSGVSTYMKRRSHIMTNGFRLASRPVNSLVQNAIEEPCSKLQGMRSLLLIK